MTHDIMHTCSPLCDRPICVAVRKAVEAEREACAKAVEVFDKTFQTGGVIAHAIRARGKHE